jgi:hypothetical protein
LEHFGGTPLSLRDGSEHQVTQEVRIVFLKHSGIDGDGTHGTPAIGGHLDHATARRGLDGAICQLALELLQTPLDLLSQLEELLKICHAIG